MNTVIFFVSMKYRKKLCWKKVRNIIIGWRNLSLKNGFVAEFEYTFGGQAYPSDHPDETWAEDNDVQTVVELLLRLRRSNQVLPAAVRETQADHHFATTTSKWIRKSGPAARERILQRVWTHHYWKRVSSIIIEHLF